VPGRRALKPGGPETSLKGALAPPSAAPRGSADDAAVEMRVLVNENVGLHVAEGGGTTGYPDSPASSMLVIPLSPCTSLGREVGECNELYARKGPGTW
jgi:hypothetical protein